VALFRSAGYPARFVSGVIEFFPDIEAAYNLTGINDPFELALFFQKAGIPYEPVIRAGRLFKQSPDQPYLGRGRDPLR